MGRGTRRDGYYWNRKNGANRARTSASSNFSSDAAGRSECRMIPCAEPGGSSQHGNVPYVLKFPPGFRAVIRVSKWFLRDGR